MEVGCTLPETADPEFVGDALPVCTDDPLPPVTVEDPVGSGNVLEVAMTEGATYEVGNDDESTSKSWRTGVAPPLSA